MCGTLCADILLGVLTPSILCIENNYFKEQGAEIFVFYVDLICCVCACPTKLHFVCLYLAEEE